VTGALFFVVAIAEPPCALPASGPLVGDVVDFTAQQGFDERLPASARDGVLAQVVFRRVRRSNEPQPMRKRPA
jgi:hypothetical protein